MCGRRVSHAKWTDFTGQVNLLCTYSKRVYSFMHMHLHAKQTHLSFCEHVFHTRRTRSCLHALDLACVFPGEVCTLVLNASSLWLCRTTYLLFLWSTRGLLCLKCEEAGQYFVDLCHTHRLISNKLTADVSLCYALNSSMNCPSLWVWVRGVTAIVVLAGLCYQAAMTPH